MLLTKIYYFHNKYPQSQIKKDFGMLETLKKIYHWALIQKQIFFFSVKPFQGCLSYLIPTVRHNDANLFSVFIHPVHFLTSRQKQWDHETDVGGEQSKARFYSIFLIHVQQLEQSLAHRAPVLCVVLEARRV